MAEEQFLSPGVFTQERDLTFLPQGIQEIAGAFVGRTSKGPAFEPVLVDSPRDYIETFGDGDFYTDFTVPNYLEDAGSAYVVRLLGSEGYEAEAIELQLPAGALDTDDPGQDLTLGTLVPTRSLREDNDRIVGANIVANGDDPTGFGLEIQTAGVDQSFTDLVGDTALSGFTGNITDIELADGGSKLYATTSDGSTGRVAQFDLSTPYDVSSASFVTEEILSEDPSPEDLVITNGGSTLLYVGSSSAPASVYEYDISSAYDITTISGFTSQLDVSNETTAPTGIEIDQSNNRLFVSGSGSTVHQYDLGGGVFPDLAGATTPPAASYTNTTELTSISSIDIVDSGNTLLVADSDQTVHSFGLDNAYDVGSTVTFGGEIDLSQDVDDLRGLVDQVSEGSIYVSDWAEGSVLEYEIALDDTGNPDFATLGELPESTTYVLSLDDADNNYVLDFFGGSVEGVREIFFKSKFPNLWAEIIDEASGTLDEELRVEFNSAQIDYSDKQYDNASTPWIVSQDQQPAQPGTDRQRLVRFHTLSDGEASNREIKVSLQTIRYPSEVPGSEYGTFDVVVRAFDDSDRNPEVLESFTAVNLDPNSDSFIASVIGNKNRVFDGEKVRDVGEYENNSDYIRVSVSDQLRDANGGNRNELSHLIPWGFESYQIPLDFKDQITGLKTRKINTVTDPDTEVVDGTDTLEQDIVADIDPNTAIFDTRINYGFDFDFEDNETFLQAIANNQEAVGDQDLLNQNFNFVFSDGFVNNGGTVESIDYGDGPEEGFPVRERNLAVAFQGGFDGQDPTTPVALGEDITSGNSQGLDLSGYNAPGAESYRDAFRILSNDDRFDINLLATPGVIYDKHQTVVQSGIDMVEARGDVFYVFDPVGPDATIQEATNSIQTLDTNYAASYFPWVRVRDRDTGRQREVPPSAVIPRVYAFSDRNSAEWFAPAGLERGGIPEVIEPVLRLRKDERDELYSNRVNPIAEFQGQGTVVFGQKTLQVAPSALDRVNVRRLLINVKKFVASTSRFLVFEQNVPATRNRFKNIVNPFLENIQQQQGLFAFRVEMNADNNPPEVIDRNELRGQIFLQPTRTAEFVSIQFNLLPTGAEFENI